MWLGISRGWYYGLDFLPGMAGRMIGGKSRAGVINNMAWNFQGVVLWLGLSSGDGRPNDRWKIQGRGHE